MRHAVCNSRTWGQDGSKIKLSLDQIEKIIVQVEQTNAKLKID